MFASVVEERLATALADRPAPAPGNRLPGRVLASLTLLPATDTLVRRVEFAENWWVHSGLATEDELAHALADLTGVELVTALQGRLAKVGGDLSRFCDAEQLVLIEAWDRVTSWVAAQQRTTIAAFAAHRGYPARKSTTRRDGALSPDAYAADELAAVLHISVRAAEGLLGDAVDLSAHLPRTLTQLRDGKLTVAGVRAVLDETAVLDPGDRAKVEEVIYCDRPGRLPYSKHPRNVRNRCRRAVLGIDPDAAHKRERAARRGRGVLHRPEPDGMSTLTITAALPDAAAAFEHLDTHARALARADGEIRGLEAIRSDLAIGALTGQVFLGNPDTLTTPQGLHSVLPAVVTDTDTRLATDPTPGATQRPRRSRTIRAEIVITGADTTLAGLDQRPGHLAGNGPVTAQTLRAMVQRAGIIDTLTTDPATGAVTTVTRHLVTDTPDGGIRLTPLAADRCLPANPYTGVDSYTPPAAMARLVMARDRTCRYPGCARQAIRCDLDHTIAHPEGSTCPGNLGALCRRHHRLKQTDGWHLTQPQPGTFIWTTPTGHTWHVAAPDPLAPD